MWSLHTDWKEVVNLTDRMLQFWTKNNLSEMLLIKTAWLAKRYYKLSNNYIIFLT